MPINKQWIKPIILCIVVTFLWIYIFNPFSFVHRISFYHRAIKLHGYQFDLFNFLATLSLGLVTLIFIFRQTKIMEKQNEINLMRVYLNSFQPTFQMGKNDSLEGLYVYNKGDNPFRIKKLLIINLKLGIPYGDFEQLILHPGAREVILLNEPSGLYTCIVIAFDTLTKIYNIIGGNFYLSYENNSNRAIAKSYPIGQQLYFSERSPITFESYDKLVNYFDWKLQLKKPLTETEVDKRIEKFITEIKKSSPK